MQLEIGQSSELGVHEQLHGKEKPHKQSECGKSISQSSTLIYPWRIHTGERSCKCGEGGKNFRMSW
ncbi:hypothetical protein EK904_011590 [Melospiza melodia maxima]|nr:hypothetical protein EK904_011590 [Melospiza melodia maxima]